MPIIERRILSTFPGGRPPSKGPMKTILEHLSSTGQGTTLRKDASKTTAKTTKETERHLRGKQKATAIPLSPRTRIPLSLRARIQTQDFYRRRNQDKPQKARKTEDDHDGTVSGTSLKLAMQFLSRPENKWSGPRDKRYSTDDYVRHY